MRLRRVLPLLLVAVLTGACGGDDDDEPTAAPPAPEADATDEQDGEPTDEPTDEPPGADDVECTASGRLSGVSQVPDVPNPAVTFSDEPVATLVAPDGTVVQHSWTVGDAWELMVVPSGEVEAEPSAEIVYEPDPAAESWGYRYSEGNVTEAERGVTIEGATFTNPHNGEIVGDISITC